MKRGFTLVELLVVIAIMAVLSGLGTVVFSNFARQDLVLVEARKIKSLAVEARTKTVAGFNLGGAQALNFGLYFLNDRYYLFPGLVWDSGNASNQEFLLPGSVAISEIELPNDSLVFEKISGEVSNFDPAQNYLVLSDQNGTGAKKISVNRLGTVMIEEL